MPPRWPRKPDRQDPEFRRLDDRMNFAVHVALFLAFNSGLWFFHNFKYSNWSWLVWFSSAWLSILILHLAYITLVADYSATSRKQQEKGNS